MKRTVALFVSALLLAGCTTSSTLSIDEAPPEPDSAAPTSSTDGETPAPSPARPQVAPPAPAQVTVTSPVLTDVELDLRDVSISTTAYALTLDEGTPWETPVVVAVPDGWSYDPDRLGFFAGDSSMVFTADCAGVCEIKGWTRVLSADGAFLDSNNELFSEIARSGFSSSSGDVGGYETVYATRDDGSGALVSAHYSHDAGRYVGCTAMAAPGSVALVELRHLCEQMQIDWSTATASTPEYVYTQRLTDEAAAAVADPAPGLPTQSFSIDGRGTISIALPAGSTVDDDGEEIRLGDTSRLFSDITLTGTCDGFCGAQDWGTKLQEPGNSIGGTRLTLDLVNDSPVGDDGWLISGQRADGDHTVKVVRWNDEVSRFFVCQASIDEQEPERVNDLINICLSAEPDWSTW